jgi:hypothetical protein
MCQHAGAPRTSQFLPGKSQQLPKEIEAPGIHAKLPMQHAPKENAGF